MSIGVFTNLCEEDAGYATQFLAEIERLGFPYAIHFDRCSAETKERLGSHPLCIGRSYQENAAVEYTEQHKQACMDIVQHSEKFDWALHWDIDETWEKDAPAKMAAIDKLQDVDLIDLAWRNLWGDPQHIRMDGGFGTGHRVKFYNLRNGRQWKFDHPITYGCKMVDYAGNVLNGVGVCQQSDLVCLHWGFMTQELREFHRTRWNRIYGKAVGANPYGFWNFACDESITPIVVENPYL
jgi:hypothetical protein